MKHVGIVLSGGGARGIAHVGVLKVLDDNNIRPEFISGASMGAVVGLFYAAGKSPDEIYQMLRHIKLLNIYKLQRPSLGFTDLSFLKRIIEKTLGKNLKFSDLQKKLFVSVSNLSSGEYEIIEDGNVIEAVMASASIPMIFKPVIINNTPYVDGGMLNNLPVEPLKKVARTIIGVSIVPHGPTKDTYSTFGEIVERCFALTNWQNVKSRLIECDILIEPKGVFQHHIFDFKNAEKLYQYGLDTANEMLPYILKVIDNQPQDYRETFIRSILGDGR